MARRKVVFPLLIGLCAAGLFFSTLGIGAQQAPTQQAPQVQAPQTPPGQAGEAGRPARAGQAGRAGGGFARGPQPREADPKDVAAMAAALPAKAAVKPKQPRRVLVYNKCNGFVTSSIPLATEMVKMFGEKSGAWTTDVGWEPDVITAENLKKYDVIVLNSTTGNFLDDPNDQAVTAARRKAFMDFVRGGKGIVGIHGAVDSYHAPRAPRAQAGEPAPPPPPALPLGSSWLEFTQMMNGIFKFHWVNEHCYVKLDDPKSPINASFKGQPYELTDETYTYTQDSYSRKNAHILTSLDYSKMPDEEKAKEPAATKRTDGDYGISWIRREGKGRVFYEAHGHLHHVFAYAPWVEHVMAGIQYAAGDLKADDSPSVKAR
jgi:type 1 glutamine amidotransferase